MPARHRALLVILIAGLVGFIVSGFFSPYWSVSDVLFAGSFAVVFLFVAFISLLLRGNKPVRGQYGLPRWLWVLFASFATVFAVVMLGATIALPWYGYEGFDYLFGENGGWWVFPLLVIVVYPFVNRRLL